MQGMGLRGGAHENFRGLKGSTTISRLTNYFLVDEMSHLGDDLPLLP